MIIPCPTKIECECSDNPFANLSAEDPDMLRYFGENYGWPYYFPNLGSNWTRNSCLGTCFSTISQAEADMCAALNAAICEFDYSGTCVPPNCPPGGGGGGGGAGGNPGIPPITYYNSLASCEVACPDFNVFRYQVGAGRFVASSQVLADRMALSEACKLAVGNVICLGSLTESACKGSPYISVLLATASVPVSFSVVSGQVPPGLAFVPYTLYSTRLAGEPTTSGTFTFTVRAQDARNNYMEKVFTISVLGLDYETLPDGEVSTAYTETLTASGGLAPYTFAVVSGALPDGLTLNSFGTISGTPTTEEDATFTVEVTDSSADAIKCQKEYTIHVEPAVVNLKAWYPFEELAPPPFVDVVNIISLVPLSGSAGIVSQTAGKVGTRALLLSTNASPTTCHVTQSPSNANMKIGTAGFTITGWFATGGSGAGDYAGVRFGFFNGIWINGAVGNPVSIFRPYAQWRHSSAAFVMGADDSAGNPLFTEFQVAVAAPATWNFFTFIYSLSTGRLYFSLNNGALSQSVDAYVFALPYTTGKIQIENVNNSGGIFTTGYDEVNYWDSVLSAAEISDLWNGGAGKTYP